MRSARYLLFAVCVLAAAGAFATSYTQNPNLNSFTTNVVFGTFIQDYYGDVGLPYTPTPASVNLGYRLVGNGSSPTIIAQFANAVSTIIVFPNLDHYGSQYDGYQYTISGSNDGINYTRLFDATSVVGSSEPFTLGTYTGTAPYLVNNVLTPGAGPGGTVGYEAYFSFGTAYRWYQFGASTVAYAQENADEELSAVATPVPEPGTIVLLGTSLLGVAGAARRKWLQ